MKAAWLLGGRTRAYQVAKLTALGMSREGAYALIGDVVKKSGDVGFVRANR